MGDFLVDFRPGGLRAVSRAAEFLKFHPDMQVEVREFAGCNIALSSADDAALWGSFNAGETGWVGLCGRVALEQSEWDAAGKIEGAGGLACKFIWKSYCDGGVQKLAEISGNFVILIFDRIANKFLLLTDRWGLVPAFRFDGGEQPVFSSHPDALADAVGESRNWDLTSFADFILTGKLCPPYTYYKRIRVIPSGAVTTVDLNLAASPRVTSRSYFDFKHCPQPENKIDSLAEEFAAALRKSITKRTLPLLGTSAVGLSGGLDSRAILTAAPGRKQLISFSCYDEENNEFRIARAIAREAGVKFVPLQRGFDYYGDSAALGVKISGGMGCIASNHFLGFRRELQNLGVQNLVTGCYCDYLYKGLALNRQINRWTTQERLAPFEFAFYGAHFESGTELSKKVRARQEESFPAELRNCLDEPTALRLEHRRLFPLAYEEDNAERCIPQRTMGWYVPIAENDLLTVHQKMSVTMRLNRRLFAKMTPLVCGPAISRIPDANTGAPVNASMLREALHTHFQRAQNAGRRLLPTRVTSGSWMNWQYYIKTSKVVRSLWSAPNPEAEEIFRQVLGKENFSTDVNFYEGRRLAIFLQLFTLKLWLDQRPR